MQYIKHNMQSILNPFEDYLELLTCELGPDLDTTKNVIEIHTKADNKVFAVYHDGQTKLIYIYPTGNEPGLTLSCDLTMPCDNYDDYLTDVRMLKDHAPYRYAEIIDKQVIINKKLFDQLSSELFGRAD